jgi:hypothetical protein
MFSRGVNAKNSAVSKSGNPGPGPVPKTRAQIIKKRCQPETRMTGGAEQKSNLSKNVLQMKVHF